MERMRFSSSATEHAVSILITWLQRLHWGLRNGVADVIARIGMANMCSLLLALLAILAGLMWQRQHAQREQLQAALAVSGSVSAMVRAASDTPLSGAVEPDDRSRLASFDSMLLPHADIPQVIQDLLQLAASQGLSVQRGEYRAQPDVAGGFLRYGMTLPVSGDAAAVERFMQTALRTQPMLLLDNWHLQRQQRSSGQIEARLQWVLLARLPAPLSAVNAASKAVP